MLDKNMEKTTRILMDFRYPKSTERKKVMPKGMKSYQGFVMGDIYSWAHKDVKETGAIMRPSRRNSDKRFSEVWSAAQKLANDHSIKYTTIQFNKNHKCVKHIDGTNAGISTIIGLGNYEGGRLLIYFDGENEPPTEVDIKNKFYEFDGSKYYHETEDFTGERHTLVYFTREWIPLKDR